MSYDLLLRTAKNLWETQWASASAGAPERRSFAAVQPAVTPAMLGTLIDLVAEDPRRPAVELQPIIQRMLFENSFIDDGGDSVVFDAFDHIETQSRILTNVLEEVRQMALRHGIWSGEPAAPMMFG